MCSAQKSACLSWGEKPNFHPWLRFSFLFNLNCTMDKRDLPHISEKKRFVYPAPMAVTTLLDGMMMRTMIRRRPKSHPAPAAAGRQGTRIPFWHAVTAHFIFPHNSTSAAEGKWRVFYTFFSSHSLEQSSPPPGFFLWCPFFPNRKKKPRGKRRFFQGF